MKNSSGAIIIKGRDIFERYKKYIDFSSKLFGFVPRFIQLFILMIFDGSESKVALLIRYLYLRNNIRLCGDNIFIGKYVTLKNLENLSLGSNISIHAYCYIDAAGEILIDDDVSIANHTSIISFDHTWQDIKLPIKYNEVNMAKVHIEQDVWIGAGCRILSGTNVGTRSIVAAGAVVNKSVRKNAIVGGVPAKLIKELE